MELVYRKTERGQAEIATRQHKLAPRLRSALIVVDGKRSGQELATMIASEPHETLQALLEAGFIEVAHDPQAAPAEAAAPGATAAPRATAPGSATAGAATAAAVVDGPPPTTEHEDTISGVYSPTYMPTMPLPLHGTPEGRDRTAPRSPDAVPAAARGHRWSRTPTLADPAGNIDDTKRHAMQWLSEQLGPYATGVNQRIARCESAEALGSAILVARSVVEQQLGAEPARNFEAEMFAALRRAVAA